MPRDAVRELVDTVCAPLGLSLGDDQLRQLLTFEALLARWNETYNLTAARDRDALRRQHLADCLAVVGPVARALSHRWPDGDGDGDGAGAGVGLDAGAGARILDVGSGGGLPGAVLAIALPRATVWCVDAVGKKAAFVRQVAAEAGVPGLHGVHARVEALRPAQPFDLITCRAWTALGTFVSMTRPLLSPSGIWGAMKSRQAAAETQALPADIAVFHVEPLMVPMLDSERCIVWMRSNAAATTAPLSNAADRWPKR